MRICNYNARGCLRGLALASLLACTCAAAQAATVDVGTHLVLPNTANQVIMIQVAGSEQIAGEDYYAQIGDGGAFNGGINTKPLLTNVDILGGTIFAGNNTGATGDALSGNATHPLNWATGTVTNVGTVTANGLLAKLTIDTTGLNSGSFPILLTGVANTLGTFNTTLRDANGAAIPLGITNGQLIVSSLPAADYNHNGVVDAADYTIWRDTLGLSGANLAADGDHDNAVTMADYNLWKADFGFLSPGSGATNVTLSTVPEPRSIALAAIGLIGLVVVAWRSDC